jgi:tetratricopeptide (TPR) repeat protein
MPASGAEQLMLARYQQIESASEVALRMVQLTPDAKERGEELKELARAQCCEPPRLPENSSAEILQIAYRHPVREACRRALRPRRARFGGQKLVFSAVASFVASSVALSSALADVGNVGQTIEVQPEQAASVNVSEDPAVRSAAPDMSEVWDWVREGDAAFDAADFDTAIRAYERALARLSQTPEWASQSNLVRKLASDALVGRYRVRRDGADLRRARELLATYAEALPESSSDRSVAQSKVEELDAEIQALAERRVSARTEFREMSEIADQRRTSAGQIAAAHALEAKRYGRLALGSWIGAGLGLVTLSIAVPYTVISKRDADIRVNTTYRNREAYEKAVAELRVLYPRIDRSTSIALVGAIATGVFAVCGTTFSILRNRSAANARKIAVDLAMEPDRFQLQLRGRF